MKSYGLVCCCLLALLAVATAVKSYAGYQVIRTTPLKDVKDLEKLKPLLSNLAYDFWSTPRVGHEVDIMTSPENVPVLWGELILLGLQPSVLVPDVGVTVEKEREMIEQMRANEKRQGRAPALDRYLDFNEIQAYLTEVVATYPSIASIINIGSSYGGRPMNVLKLSNGPGKTGIFFDAAIHAREWLGPPTLLYSINELTENLAANQAMLDANDFYFLPVANPDGYDWTWTDDRMWRKTRKPNSGSSCIGTDGNRNYDYHWGEDPSNPGPCSDIYPGSAPFSEPEVKAMADFLTANPQITSYLTIHAYGKMLMYPWGWTNTLPPQAPELDLLANNAANALSAVDGTLYDVGSIANVIYLAYGGSVDWTMGGINLIDSFAFELPGGGLQGFNPPPDRILPVCLETWEAYKVFAADIPASRG